MLLSEQAVKAKYQSGAKYYDLFVWIYPFIGLRMGIYRSHAVEFLRLKRGNCVVKLGCGTGLNFSRIVERIGPSGRLIGVDLTPGMLACARDRVARARWKNVELIQLDITEYNFPERVNAVLSVGVFGFVAEHECLIKAIS